MFCPNCSEPKANDTTQFCKRCGLDLFGLSEFVESGASDVRTPDAKGKQAKGIRQGAKLFALGLILIPVWMFIGIIFPPNDRLVESAPSTTALEAMAWIAMWMAFIAGALRIAYAVLFEEKRSTSLHRPADGPANKSAQGLPSGDAFRPAAPGGWKTTGELFEPVKRKTRTSGEL